MKTEHLKSHFAAMGARLKVLMRPPSWPIRPQNYSLDIQHDRHGSFFEIRVTAAVQDLFTASVLQAEPQQRHLLLLMRRTDQPAQLDRFLCGHDEREWFVAAVPGRASTVTQAMEALQPEEVRTALIQHQLSPKLHHTRKNPAFRRQGEWFFLPVPSLQVDEQYVLHQEPLRRGPGKPHWAEQLYRTGGQSVYVESHYPNGLTEKEYRALLQRMPMAARWGWQVLRRNPEVYVRGTIRHSDHATITLKDWHRVLMNTETQTRTMSQVAFLD